jgi:chromosome segregation ATPase
MNENWHLRCDALFALLMGREPRSGEIETLKQSSESYEHFRIRLVSEALYVDELGAVLSRWQQVIAPSDLVANVQINTLMHTVEVLREKQSMMEEALERAEGEMLDLLKKVDTLATQYISRSEEVKELKAVAVSVASKIAEIDRVFSSRKGGVA